MNAKGRVSDFLSIKGNNATSWIFAKVSLALFRSALLCLA